MKHYVGAVISAVLCAALCGCTKNSGEEDFAPVYNSTVSSLISENSTVPSSISETRSSTSAPAVSDPPEKQSSDFGSFAPLNDRRPIKCGNALEQNATYGHYCTYEGKTYYVDLNDGFLYCSDFKTDTPKLVLKDYVRALNCYDGYIYYIKGDKEHFEQREHFYKGNVWRLNIAAGKEECIIDDNPINLCLVVNEYGVFCNKAGGGIALYDYDGNFLKTISDINQGIYIIDNWILLRKEDKTVFLNLDTGEESDFFDIVPAARCGNILVGYSMDNQWVKQLFDLSTGETTTLPKSEMFSFAYHKGTLYAINNYAVFRYDNDSGFTQIYALEYLGELYFMSIFSSGDKLVTVVMNQEDAAWLAEISESDGIITLIGE